MTSRDASTPTRANVRVPVVVASMGIVVAVALWGLLAPAGLLTAMTAVVGWMTEWFGWAFILLATAVLVFVVVIGVRWRHVRLGPDDERPRYSMFAWASMLFAAGIGTDIMFFSVAEPVSQYLAPPQLEPGSLAAAEQAPVWTMFHYGLHGWGMYVLMGVAMGFVSHRLGLPLAVRSTLEPLLGRRVRGPIGDAVDVATVVATIFGLATSLGIGVVMLAVGLDLLLGMGQGSGVHIALVVLAVAVAIVSAVSGVDRGIRRLSQLNVVLSFVLVGWVLVAGDTAFLLRSLVMNVGDFVALLPGMSLDTMAYDHPADWTAAWTLFFWAWWIAWAAFVGLFLARISRGRTIGEFVAGALTIPFAYIVLWATVLGNHAVHMIRDEGRVDFGELTMAAPEQGFFTLLQDLPLSTVVVALACIVGLLFYVTSADSGALVMANLSSRLPSPDTDARPGLRIGWALATGLLTIGMLAVDGIPALQSATIIMALPFAVVMVLVMCSLVRALRGEERTSAIGTRHPHAPGEQHWCSPLQGDHRLDAGGPHRGMDARDEPRAQAHQWGEQQP